MKAGYPDHEPLTAGVEPPKAVRAVAHFQVRRTRAR
jgi:hypothetical protein